MRFLLGSCRGCFPMAGEKESIHPSNVQIHYGGGGSAFWRLSVLPLLFLGVVIPSGGVVYGAQVPVRTVVLSGDPAPGTPNGHAFTGFLDFTINNAGQVSFWALTNGAGVLSGSGGAWTDASGTLQPLAQNGTFLPGADQGNVFLDFVIDTPLISDSGHTTVFGVAWCCFNFGIWRGDAGGLGPVAIAGGHVPVPSVNLTYDFIGVSGASIFGGPASSAQLSSAFFATLGGTGGGRAVVKEVAGNYSIVARAGQSAPGTSGTFIVFGKSPETMIPTLNDHHQCAFYARCTSGAGVWSEGGGTLQLVALRGMPAPGTTGTFNDFRDPRINNDGKIAFAGLLQGSGVTTFSNTGIWSEGSGSLALIAREGSPAPGMGEGVVYGELLNAPLIGTNGRVAFSGPVSGPSIDALHDSAAWIETANGVQLVAQEGMPAPGAAAGVEFDQFFQMAEYWNFGAINANGRLVFHASLRGPGLVSPNSTIWTFGLDGILKPVVLPGDTIEVRPGDIRTVRELSGTLRSGGEDGHPRGLNNSSEVIFRATFTDGTSGIFVTRVVDASPSGDMNCDGALDVQDVEAMALALVDPTGYSAQYPGCDPLNGDFIVDQLLDGRDVQGFVEALVGQ